MKIKSIRIDTLLSFGITLNSLDKEKIEELYSKKQMRVVTKVVNSFFCFVLLMFVLGQDFFFEIKQKKKDEYVKI